MSLISRLLDILGGPEVTVAQARAEAWALGGRHFGDVLEGARQELQAADLTPARAKLLQAVIRWQTLRPDPRFPSRAPA